MTTARRSGIVAPVPSWGDLLTVGCRAAGPGAPDYLRGMMAELNTERQGVLPLMDGAEEWAERRTLAKAILQRLTAAGDGTAEQSGST